MFTEASRSYSACWQRGNYFFPLHVRKSKVFKILLLFFPLQSLILAGLLCTDVTCGGCSLAVMPPIAGQLGAQTGVGGAALPPDAHGCCKK